MRRVLASLTLLLPLLAAGQTVGVASTDPLLAPGIMTPEWVEAAVARQGVDRQDALLPLWQATDGRMLSLTASGTRDQTPGFAPMDFQAMAVTSNASSGLRFDFGPHLRTHLGVAQHGWLGLTGAGECPWATHSGNVSCLDDRLVRPSVFDSEIGASFHANGYSVGVGVSASKPAMAPSLLPRVLPDTPVTASGLPLSALDNSTSLRANGRVPLGGHTGIDLGASVGRIRLLPGNLLGISTLGQKSLSLGVDSGPLSGHIVGRVVQPETGNESALGPDKRWTSVDLGVTWRLPWQGSLSFGAQNLWSSGQAPTPKDGPEPDQSRIPYVQYHQDL
jgi:hypothetical protein